MFWGTIRVYLSYSFIFSQLGLLLCRRRGGEWGIKIFEVLRQGMIQKHCIKLYLTHPLIFFSSITPIRFFSYLLLYNFCTLPTSLIHHIFSNQSSHLYPSLLWVYHHFTPPSTSSTQSDSQLLDQHINHWTQIQPKVPQSPKL